MGVMGGAEEDRAVHPFVSHRDLSVVITSVNVTHTVEKYRFE